MTPDGPLDFGGGKPKYDVLDPALGSRPSRRQQASETDPGGTLLGGGVHRGPSLLTGQVRHTTGRAETSRCAYEGTQTVQGVQRPGVPTRPRVRTYEGFVCGVETWTVALYARSPTASNSRAGAALWASTPVTAPSKTQVFLPWRDGTPDDLSLSSSRFSSSGSPTNR